MTVMKSFTLRSHHEGHKPYLCPVAHCDKSFTRSDELQRHVRTHDGTRPYACVVCSKAFLRRDHIRKHMRTHPDYQGMWLTSSDVFYPPGAILPPPNRRVSKKQTARSQLRLAYAGGEDEEDEEEEDEVGGATKREPVDMAYMVNDLADNPAPTAVSATIVDITPVDDLHQL